MLLLIAVATLATGPAVSHVDSVKWTVDPVHSEVSFKVRHFVTTVPGTFTQWTGEILTDPAKLSGGSVAVAIQAASISTKSDRRDTHLRSADFLAVDSFPTITF